MKVGNPDLLTFPDLLRIARAGLCVGKTSGYEPAIFGTEKIVLHFRVFLTSHF